MATTYKRAESPFYFCSFRAPDGRWLKKSTKQTDKRKALEICLEWEKTSIAAKEKTLTTSQVRRVFNEMLAYAGDEPLEVFSIKDWCNEWIAIKEKSHTANTGERYKKPILDFLEHLGPRCDLPLRSLTPKDIRTFRDSQREAGRAAVTTNFSHKTIASCLEAACRQGYIDKNPSQATGYLQTHREKIEKGIFTADEVRAILAAVPSQDWYGVILLAYFTGLRLGDCLSLEWINVDFQARAIRITPKKTARLGKSLTIPLHPNLEAFLLKHPTAGNSNNTPVFPSLSKLSIGGNRGASRVFQSIVQRAGVSNATLRESAGEVGRQVKEKSFHSFRHGFVSALETAGADPAVRQRLAGHSSESQNLHYTHPEFRTMQAAIAQLPAL